MNPELLLNHFNRISDAPDAIPRLRKFVLDLAVRGKLVEQDSNDEPASVLLKRIEAERARLVREGEIKKLEVFEPVGAGEIPFPIPFGWEAIRMGWLARKLGAGSTPLGGKSVYQKEGVPFLRSQNVHDSGLRLDEVALISRAIHDRMSGTHIQQQDILLNITGASIGRCALVPNTFVEGNVSQHVAIIRLFLPAVREFIHLSLTSPFFQKVIDDVQVGVSREGLSMQKLRLFPMLIPPLAEQFRIVTRVNELMELCDRLETSRNEQDIRRDRLASASLYHLNNGADADAFREHANFYVGHLPCLTSRSDQIKQLRQTILNLAVRGRLVSQDRKDEPASVLLKRIQDEKAAMVEQRKIRRQDPLPQIDVDAAPFAIPASWEWTRLGTVCFLITDGAHHTPTYEDEGVPFLSVKDVSTGTIDFSNTRLISKTAHQELCKRCRPEFGDILLTKVGTTGIAVTVDVKSEFSIFVSLALLKFSKANLNRFYLRHLINSPFVKRQSADNTQGIGNKNLVLRLINQFAVPIPPLAEQHRIVAKVNELMRLCDRLEAQLITAKDETSRLLDAVLHHALHSSDQIREEVDR